MSKAVELRGVRIGEGVPKICVPLLERSTEELLAAAVSLSSVPHDLVEWRADYLNDPEDGAEVLEALTILRRTLGNTPLLVSFRTEAEGGAYAVTEEGYERFFERVLKSGDADLVDLETSFGPALSARMIARAHEHDVKVIMSRHYFHDTPAEEKLFSILKGMEEQGADIAKLAVMPKDADDVLKLLSATRKASVQLRCPVVTMAMGEVGTISRISGELFGSAITFGAASRISAPGQLSAEPLQDLLKILHEGGRT